MLIVGAKGFASELLEVMYQHNDTDDLVFYDDITVDGPDKMYDKYKILKSENMVEEYFKGGDKGFTLGIGNSILRQRLYNKFLKLGGQFVTTRSIHAKIGHHDISIGDGCNIMDNAIISNEVTLGKGVLVYYNALVTHNVQVGDFVEISPNASLLGRSQIGELTQIGCGSVVLPDIKIGKRVLIAAGSVVTRDVPDDSMVAGVPAIFKKKINLLASK